MKLIANRALTGAAVLLALAAPLTMQVAQAQAKQATATGEIRKIDMSEGKVMIRHGAIADLSLPAMTLVYRIDAALLAGLKPGDTVTFTAQRDADGQYRIVKIGK